MWPWGQGWAALGGRAAPSRDGGGLGPGRGSECGWGLWSAQPMCPIPKAVPWGGLGCSSLRTHSLASVPPKPQGHPSPLTIVIKAMRDLVPDHHPNAPKVQGLWLLLAEEGRLEDPRGKHWGDRGSAGRHAPVCLAQAGFLGSCHPDQEVDIRTLRVQMGKQVQRLWAGLAQGRLMCCV